MRRRSNPDTRIQAVITACDNHLWKVVWQTQGIRHELFVDRQDAWDYDIYDGLNVRLATQADGHPVTTQGNCGEDNVPLTCCRIVKRHNNKRFVRIREEAA